MNQNLSTGLKTCVDELPELWATKLTTSHKHSYMWTHLRKKWYYRLIRMVGYVQDQVSKLFREDWSNQPSLHFMSYAHDMCDPNFFEPGELHRKQILIGMEVIFETYIGFCSRPKRSKENTWNNFLHLSSILVTPIIKSLCMSKFVSCIHWEQLYLLLNQGLTFGTVRPL